MSIPAPSMDIVLVPAMVEEIVAVTFDSTVKDAAPAMVNVPELTLSLVLKVRLVAETVEAVMVPVAPQKMASLPSAQACSIPELVFHQLTFPALQVPVPPRFAPLKALFPAVEPSASQ
jgi:hypothetical protein